ncbi:MAG: hypothetical protein AUI33_17010, partial [Ignavibacteria bacterium 13_1_40CM_2_61_4]
CPLNNYHYLKAGWIGLNIVHEYINQDQIYVGSSKSFVGAIPRDHDEVQTLNERSVLQLQLGIMDKLGLGVDVPFVHREHSHIAHHQAGDEWESWNFSGLGDVVLTGQFALILPADEFDPYLSFIGGVKLATGVTDEKNVAGEEAEITIQPGTGSVDEFIGFNYRQTILSVPTISGEYGALPVTLGVTYQFNGAGRDDYRAGNILHAHVATSYQLARRASVLLQANGKFQDYADVGSTGEPRDNTGGTWIFLSPGIGLQMSDALGGSFYIQIPFYQNVHGIQQTAKFNLLFGLSYNFDLLASE